MFDVRKLPDMPNCGYRFCWKTSPLAEPADLGDEPIVDADCDAVWLVVQGERWMLVVIRAKDSASCLDSTSGVRFGAPDKKPQVKGAECGWYRIGANPIDAEERNLAGPFGHDDHRARSDCVVV